MFEKTWHFVKEHPYAIGGGIILLIVLYVVFNSASSSGDSTQVAGQTGPSDAAVNAGAAFNIAQLQAGVASGQTQAQLAAVQIGANTTVTTDTLAADVAKYQTEQAANVQQSGIAANENVQITGIQSQTLIAQANSALQAFLAGTSADVQKTQINAVRDIVNAPTNLAIAQVQALGPNLGSVITNAENVKNSYVSVGGITAGRNTPASSFNPSNALATLGASLAAII